MMRLFSFSNSPILDRITALRGVFATLVFVCVAATASAQVTGVVLDDRGDALIGANVFWLGTGQGTATDLDGQFTLMPVKTTQTLVVSYMGYRSDTLHITDRKPLTVVLVSDLLLDEVTITERKMAVMRSRFEAFDVQTLGQEELCKAACCNLSEAFETNASVDVAYADAATGAKQIKLLGLSGTYVQLLSENTPGVRGLAQAYGMEYIPGPWMSSIQVSKGTASVINGYEATTGQINVEYLKPQTTNPLAVNLMFNSEMHAEANLTGGWEIPLKGHDHDHDHDEIADHDHDHDHDHGDKLYTGILAHYQQSCLPMSKPWAQHYMDENGDGFSEMPMGRNANLLNRWYYRHHDYTFQAVVRGLYDERHGGQIASAQSGAPDQPGAPRYAIDLRTWRVDGYIKNGYVFDEESGSSVALVAAASYHDQVNGYGSRLWDASQANAYLNALYQGNWEGGGLIDNDHRLSAGLSLNYDRYWERLEANSQVSILNFQFPLGRWEITPGIFAEYAYTYSDKLSLVAGVRLDWSNRYGFFCTPRMNVRYSPFEWWTLRASAGMGYRSPNAIADNAFMLPSSRLIHLQEQIEQERAVNTGFSSTFYVPLASRQLQLTLEYYYTHFLNALVADVDRSTSEVWLYNLSAMPGASAAGRSFAHNAQVEASIEVLRGWTWTAAFRWTDVQQTSWSQAAGDYVLRQKPLSNRFKAVITTSYQTPLKKWQFDLTAQFNGGGRMPDGFGSLMLGQQDNHQYYEKDGTLYYRWYPQLMAQITKYWRTCSLYLGAENMTNFRQQNPVIQADRPLDPGFDASMAWGPITGWKLYLGFRYALDRPDDD